MTRTRYLIASAAFVLLLAAPGDALHCNGDITAISADGQTLYVDDRSDETGEINHWLYLESNGEDGLQSGGEACCNLEVCPLGQCFTLTDPCAHADPDTLIL